MIRFSLLSLSLLAASPVMAFDADKLGQGGSLPLSDLNPLISQSAQLQTEVKAALAAAGKPADRIICSGNRFPGQWDNLGGFRAAPYICAFSGKWLLLDATVRVTGPHGRVYEKVTPEAMKHADKISETRPTWKWTTEDPFADAK